MGLRSLMEHCDNPEVQQQVRRLYQVTAQTLDEVHRLAARLRPALLDDLGLEAALQRFVRQWQEHSGLPVDLWVRLGDGRLPPVVETAVYRIVQEALTNVARHARGATQVGVLLERRRGELSLIVEDDGPGFDPSRIDYTRHLGLLGMRERAELLGGSLLIESEPGGGTVLFVRIPLSEDVDDATQAATVARAHRR